MLKQLLLQCYSNHFLSVYSSFCQYFAIFSHSSNLKNCRSAGVFFKFPRYVGHLFQTSILVSNERRFYKNSNTKKVLVFFINKMISPSGWCSGVIKPENPRSWSQMKENVTKAVSTNISPNVASLRY